RQFVNSWEDIPALATLSRTRLPEQVIRKVREGSLEPGGIRGRMPIFSYLTDEEVTAVYYYLATQPPRP
ncbi:MAG: c-type cytochrome, partial [Acidobacteriota bacterium]